MAILTASNRGLRFGDGLFETLKSHNGQVEMADEHFARLWRGLQLLQFSIPKHFSPTLLEKHISTVLNKNGHHAKARIRITIFRGDGGLYDAVDHQPNYLVQSWALPQDNGKLNNNGLVLGVYTGAQKSCDVFSNLKHNNFLPYVMGALHAKSRKWNDAVILNSKGMICDTTIANIFFISNGIVYTPAPASGCVAGVMRKHILDSIAGKYDIVEGEFTVEDLLAADEVFLTNSVYNMRWVQAIDEKKYTNTVIQKIYTSVFSTIS